MSRINVNFYYAFITFIKFYDRRKGEHVFYFQERKKSTLWMNYDWIQNVKVKMRDFYLHYDAIFKKKAIQMITNYR